MGIVLKMILRGGRLRRPRHYIHALWYEIANPRLKITLPIRALISSLQVLKNAQPQETIAAWSNDTLQFVFDLSVAPITFDFASFLAAAEIERRRLNLNGLAVIIVPGEDNGLRVEDPAYHAVFNHDARWWRVHHIILPMLRLLPSNRGFALCGTREQAAAMITQNRQRVFPEGYRISLPRQPSKRTIHDLAAGGAMIWPLLSATERGRVFVAEFLEQNTKNRKPIVITLRNSDYSPQRNSRNEDWLAFADRLDRAVFAPIFVVDTESSMRPPLIDLSGHLVCEAASWNIEIRMALYEAAHLNLALMQGPMELCWYNEKTRYIIFLNKNTAVQNMEDELMAQGLSIGRGLEFANQFQKIVWAADELVAIERAFAEMTTLLLEE